MKLSLKFLDYNITDTGNGDGIVLSKDFTTVGNLWQTHLGNFGSSDNMDNIIRAKKYALIHFMIERPQHFAQNIAGRVVMNVGRFHEYYLLRSCLEKEGIEMPIQITKSKCGSGAILFDGEPLNFKRNQPKTLG